MTSKVKLDLNDDEVGELTHLVDNKLREYRDSAPLSITEHVYVDKLKRIRRQLIIAQNMRALGYDN